MEVPFESSIIHCQPKRIKDNVEAKMTELNEEKTELIKELITTKGENQKLYFQLQKDQQKIAFLESGQIELKRKLMDQQKIIAQLTREKNACRIKVKQLMANATVKTSEKEEESSDDSNDEYEVDRILNHAGQNRNRRFLIRWHNFSPSHDSWEREINLRCPEVLNEYLELNQLSPFKKKK